MGRAEPTLPSLQIPRYDKKGSRRDIGKQVATEGERADISLIQRKPIRLMSFCHFPPDHSMPDGPVRVRK